MVKVEDRDCDGSSDDEVYFKRSGSCSRPSSAPVLPNAVKVEDRDTVGPPSDEFFCRDAGPSASKPASDPVRVKDENLSSSPLSDLRSNFIGMGFSPILVDRVINKNGDGDPNSILEALIKYSKSNRETSDSWEGSSSFDEEEENSPIQFTSDLKEEAEELGGFCNDLEEKKSQLAVMDFTEKEIDFAINTLGVDASLSDLVDCIVTAQTAGSSREKIDGVIDCDKDEDEERTQATLFGAMDKTLSLFQMGFTENEVSAAIDKFGPGAPISKLADSIFAERMGFTVDKKEELWDDADISGENQNELGPQHHLTEELPKHCRPMTGAWITKISSSTDPQIDKDSSSDDAWITKASSSNCTVKASSSNATPFDSNDVKTIKKAKYMSMEDHPASCINHLRQPRQADWDSAFETEADDYHEFQKSTDQPVKEEMPYLRTSDIPSNVEGKLSLPYFFYGNVVDVSQGTWTKLSQFLYATEPEFVNSQFFSALIRKEGYLHNLPTNGRFHIVPKSPMTTEDALPHTKNWWPPWDTRRQLSFLNSDTTGVLQICERLGKMVMDSQVFLSKEQQIEIIHQCKRFNLVWVDHHKLRPIEPDQLELILGYPKGHTEIWTAEPVNRLAALKTCFQTDTVGYHLSVLRSMFPDGLRVLSVYSGVGGAEVALHRLGIHLKCLVSVETSEVNRKILKRWWQRTGQTGELRQIGGIERLASQTLATYMNQFGGFDIIIGSNPGDSIRVSNGGGLIDMDLNHFFEFVRVVTRVRSKMGRNSC